MTIYFHHRTFGDGAEGIHISSIAESFRKLGYTVKWLAPEATGKSSGKSVPHPQRLKTIIRLIKKNDFIWEVIQIFFNFYSFVINWKVMHGNKHGILYKRHSSFDLGPLLAARVAKIPCILEVNAVFSSAGHQTLENVKLKSLMKLFERWTFRYADQIITVSTPLKEEIVRLRIPENKVIVLPNGANPEKFDPQVITGHSVKCRHNLQSFTVIGWVGIFRKWHNLDLLINAIANIPDILEKVRLLLVGDGPDEESLRNLVAERNLQNVVVFAGRVPHSEIPAYIAAMDIAVASGDLSEYASPMKILEYMAMEKAVVAPRMRNIAEIIDDRINGLLFKPDDVTDLREKLLELLKNMSLQTRLGEKARYKVKTELNWDVIAQKSLNSLEKPAM